MDAVVVLATLVDLVGANFDVVVFVDLEEAIFDVVAAGLGAGAAVASAGMASSEIAATLARNNFI